MDERDTDQGQQLRPVTITPGPTSLLLTLGSAAAFMGVLYWLIQSVPADAPAFEAILTFCVVAFSWQWLGRYRVTVDGDGISVSTNYWRLRGRAPIRFAPSAGISAVSHWSLLGRTVTINGLRIETGDIFAHDSLQVALREAAIPVRARSSDRAVLAWIGAYTAGFLFGTFAFKNPGLGVPLVSAVVVVLTGVCVGREIKVDREWRRIAAQVSSGSASPTEAAS